MTQPVFNYGLAGDSKYGRYYKHSGHINIGGVFAGLIAGLVVGAILGPLYSAAVIFIPVEKLCALICLFYGLAMGALPAVLLRRSKVRNMPVSLAVVGVATLFSFYLSWASWEAIILRDLAGAPSFAELAGNPTAVYRVAKILNGTGTWSSGNSYSSNGRPPEATKGTELLVVWIGEAGCVFVAALATCWGILHDKPFCEKCNQWCAGPATLRTSELVDPKILRTRLESGDFAFVGALPGGDATFLEYKLHRCNTCADLNTLTVVWHAITTDKKGRKKDKKNKTLVNKLLVSNDDLATLMGTTAMPAVVAAPRKPGQSPQALK